MTPITRAASQFFNQLGDGERRVVRAIRDEDVREGIFWRRKGGEERGDVAVRVARLETTDIIA